MSEQVKSESSTMKEVNESAICPGYTSLTEFTQEAYKLLMEGIKYANCLPVGRDWNFYTTFDSVKSVLNGEANHIMDNINLILSKNEVGGTLRNMSLESKTERLVDANDILLERIANIIDEMNGIRKVNFEPVKLQTVSAELTPKVNGSWNRSNAKFSVSSSLAFPKGSSQNKETTIRLLTAENIVRPQKLFKDKIDNSNDNPWQPKIKEKPNSLKPLSVLLEEVEGGDVEFSHPYLYELERFNPPDILLSSTSVTNPKLISETPLIEINKPEELCNLVEELRKYDIIGVDLEHHSYRSFMGITCLMQISTIDKDYLIDALALRSDLWILNEIFTKSDIVKVFHGAHSDVLWLQRDLSLYLVNMFDTYFASKELGYSKLSLAYLMQRFCNFLPNKQFQLADWRIRPLPQELKDYAREDTHYLIFIYQKVRNELISKANGSDNLLKSVIQNSTDLCKTRYCKPKWHEDSHLELYRRCNRMFDNRQMFALKELYKWRDYISREEDESTGYVLPNNMLLEIAQRLPREMQGIIACCNPVPPLVQANLLDLHKIVLKALEKPFEQPILQEDTRARGTTKKMSKINADSPLYCPHDLTSVEEFRDDLPTLLENGNTNFDSPNPTIEQTRSICSVFNPVENFSITEKLKRFRESFNFLSPFDRYQLVKPFIKAKEKKLAEEKLKEEEKETPKATETSQIIHLKDKEPTDEERIESVHQHFLQLSNLNKAESSTTNKKLSLIEMGGSKKRKRAQSFGVYKRKSSKSTASFDTPVPRVEIVDVPVSSNSDVRNLEIDGITLSRPSPNEPPFKQSRITNKKNRNRKRNIRFDRSRGNSNAQSRRNINMSNRSEETSNAYDYSMVDFRQFEGGSGRVQHIQPISMKYKTKGKFNGRNRGIKSSIIGKKGGF